MTAPLVSVVTVSFNASKTIRRTVDSVLAQSYPNIDYLVVDGGSTDGTREILQSYGSRLRLVSEPDYGIYDAMNKGVALAKGGWIHLLNADDWYADADALARAVPYLEDDCTNYFDILRIYQGDHTKLQSRSVRRWMLYISAFLPHPGLIVSRAQYDDVGRFDTGLKIAADHDFILRLTKRYPIRHVRSLLTCMGQGGISATDLHTSMSEFSVVIERNGLPQAAVNAIMVLRRLWWRVRASSFKDTL